ncbi:MAG: lysylphosphatidylglycerol synthase transmembrane domain-containing protein [Vicinamibacterales bacterium]|nr:lysylphosphatidylglycerol synthase transmembrane domain-containing protein [Vicinamibacterales bacterium]
MPAAPSRNLSRPLLMAAKLAVSVGLLWWVLQDVDLGALGRMILGAAPAWIALAVGAYLVMLGLSVWRWQVLLRAQHIDVRARTLLQSWLVAIFFNNFLPSNIGGDVWRVADTAPAAGSKTLATTIVLVDRALGLVALFIVAAVGAAAARLLGITVPGVQWLWLGVGAGLLAGIPFLVAPRLLTLLLAPARATGHAWILERATRFEDSFTRFRAKPASLAGAFAGAIGVQLIIVLFYAFTAYGLGIPLPLAAAGVLVPVSLVVQMVPVSINGFGVREAVFVYFFARFGLASESAIALSLLATALVMLLSLVGGGVFLTRPGVRS